MDYIKNHKRRLNPRQNANIVAKLLFSYTIRLFIKGFKADVTSDDVYEVLPEHKSEMLGSRLEKEWYKKRYRTNPSLSKLLWNCFGWHYVLLNMTQVINVAIVSVANPLLIGLLVSYYVPGQTKLTKLDAVFYSCLMIFLNFVRAIYNQNFGLEVLSLSIKMRAALGSFIYQQILNMKSPQLHTIDIGRYTTLITDDITDIAFSVTLSGSFWEDVLKTLIIVFVMYRKIGWYAFILIISNAIAVPMYIYVVTKIFALITKRSAKTDERVTISKRILASIRTIKMCAWEKCFHKLVSESRKKEVLTMSKIFYLYYVNMCIGTIFFQLCVYCILTTYVKLGEDIEAKDIFFVISSLQSISFANVFTIPAAFYHLKVFNNALRRIKVVIEHQRITDGTDSRSQRELKSLNRPKIFFEDTTFFINDKVILRNVNFKIEGGLNLITGPVGSGKSTFLKLIMGDFVPSEGTIICEGKISYASQEPWLFPSTIKQNIIFTENYNEERYYQVVRSCGLLHDFASFKNADETIVEEGGINLSKGQQLRINLARAVYRQADIYLLDDCFSVLDTIVADFVFIECILKMLKDKIVLLVTHKDIFSRYASKIINMDQNLTYVKKDCDGIKFEANFEKQVYNNSKENHYLIEDENNSNDKTALLQTFDHSKNIYEEEKESRRVPLKVYYQYIKFGGGCFVFLLVISMYVIYQLANNYKDKLLSTWSNLEQRMINYTRNNGSFQDSEFLEMSRSRNYILYLYAGIVCAIVSSLMLETFATYRFAQRVSIKFHKFLMTKMICAQMSFFSTHFLGSIFNRLYQDMFFFDRAIPVGIFLMLSSEDINFNLTTVYPCIAPVALVIHLLVRTPTRSAERLGFAKLKLKLISSDWMPHIITIELSLKSFFECMGSIILIVSVNSIFLIPTACFFLILYVLRVCYLRTAVNLKRLACSTQSAMIGYMSSTLDGLTTIQVFKGEKILQKEYNKHQDLYTSATYMHESCRMAFTCVGDLFCSVFIACVILRFLIVDEGISVGSIGLAITQAFVMSFRMYFGIAQWASFDTLMTSFERLLEYTSMKQESKKGIVIEGWPKRGEIKFENVSMAYSTSQDYALKNLNFVINARERLGIVGRTGSGKSSIISALFRLYEFEGRILIDNVDIKTLSLDLLRQQIAVIPQDPLVFPGTIRENIDPLGQYPDEKIYKAMEISKLKQIVPNLEFEIKKDTDLSVGQKQLICLARVLVRDTKIVIFDEVAEHVDHEMGVLMKKIIDDNINNCTTITIAHRLAFVMECNKVILMHNGEIVEIGQPKILLENKNGRFYRMYDKDKIL